MTLNETDFETPPLKMSGTVTTGSGTLAITGFGIVRWRVMTSDGSLDEIRVPCHLLPGFNQRLFSPQDYARFHGSPSDTDQYGGTATQVWVTLATGKRLQANMDPRGNIPVILATQMPRPSLANTQSRAHLSSPLPSPCSCSTPEPQADVGLFDATNMNLTHAQRALLLDHQRLGHLGFHHLQSLYRPHMVQHHLRSPTTTGTALDFLDPADAPTLLPVASLPWPPRAPLVPFPSVKHVSLPPPNVVPGPTRLALTIPRARLSSPPMTSSMALLFR